MHLKSSVKVESIGKVNVSTIAPLGQPFYETCLFWTGGSNVVEMTGNDPELAKAMHNRWTDPVAIAKAISDYSKMMDD